VGSLTFANDIEHVVEEPIKKIIEIIKKLAEGPLKKPDVPDPNRYEANRQM
jgi:hypothetical protein